MAACRHRLAIQSVSRAESSSGAGTDTWSTDLTVWGKITPRKGSEPERADMSQAQVTHEIEMRYNTTLTPKHRLVDQNGNIYEIVRALNRGMLNRWWDIQATEAIT